MKGGGEGGRAGIQVMEGRASANYKRERGEWWHGWSWRGGRAEQKGWEGDDGRRPRADVLIMKIEC